MDETYYVVRRYRDNDTKEIIATGLTLEEAQEHCRDPETSSSTCTLSVNVARTVKWGPWFDGYDEE